MKTQDIINLTNRHIMQTYARLPVAFVKGEGMYLWDKEGKQYLDFVSGLGVNGLGHCHPKIVKAICNQAKELMHTSNLYHIEPQARLAELLAQLTGGMKSFFCNSGAEANEAAIKLTRKYAKLNLGKNKYQIITAYKSFHGRTLATLAATAQEKYQKGFEPLPPGFKYVEFNDRNAFEKAIDEHTCAIMLEPIQGEGGVYVAEREYLSGVRQICSQNNLLLILDEVQTGLGRTGKLFAYQHCDIEPDILTLAKSLGGGLPMGAMLAKPQAAAAFQPGDHASTFGGNHLVCAAAIAALKTIEEENLSQNAQVVGEYLMQKLQTLKAKYDFIKEIRGLGLMIAIELEIPKAKEIQQKCLEQGLIINTIGDHIIRFLPPLIITKNQTNELLEALVQILNDLLTL